MVLEVEGGSGLEGLGRYIQWMTAYFYAGDGLLASTRVARLQRLFNVLV